LELIIN